jgi:hypothetical protein
MWMSKVSQDRYRIDLCGGGGIDRQGRKKCRSKSLGNMCHRKKSIRSSV